MHHKEGKNKQIHFIYLTDADAVNAAAVAAAADAAADASAADEL